MEVVNNLCRACLSSMDSFRYILFENVSPDIYWFCTSIEVMKEEELPKFLCDVCYDLLLQFAEFKSTCMKSQNTLTKTIQTTVSKREKADILQQSLEVYRNIKWKSNIKHGPSSYEELINENNKSTTEIVKEEGLDNSTNDCDTSFIDELLIEKKEKIFKRETKLLSIPWIHRAGAGPIALQRAECKQCLGLATQVYKCDMCTKRFYCAKLYKAHKLAHEKKYSSLKCIPCNKSFITKSGLKRHHIICHTSVSLSSIQCQICGKIAKSRETLRQHMKLHSSRCQFICNVCGKGYSTRGVLKDHLDTHKENREREYTCEHCGKKFFTKKNLVSHVTRCHSEKRFICQICSYPFTDKYNLAQHLLIHEGKKLFKCEVCDKSYATRSTFIEHQRIHFGERPFDCSYCSKGFISKRRLNVHLLIHTGEKPHKCPICEQSFNQRGSLNRHMKVHDRVVDTIN